MFLSKALPLLVFLPNTRLMVPWTESGGRRAMGFPRAPWPSDDPFFLNIDDDDNDDGLLYFSPYR